MGQIRDFKFEHHERDGLGKTVRSTADALERFLHEAEEGPNEEVLPLLGRHSGELDLERVALLSGARWIRMNAPGPAVGTLRRGRGNSEKIRCPLCESSSFLIPSSESFD